MLAILSASAWVVFSELPGSCAGPAKVVKAANVAEVGMASYYADKYHGRTTASGEAFDTHDLTAAHRTLPFGTRVRVTAIENNRSVIVRINDRGPFVGGRVIDVSRAAAEELQFIRAGLAKVRVEIIPAPAS
jgi:rare lipoprotein A